MVVREVVVGPDLVSQRGADTRLVRELGVLYGDRVVRKWVDADFGRRPTGNGRAIWKTLWVLFVRAIERSLTHEGDFFDASEEDLRGRIQGESRVMMIVVVPTEEGREVVLGGRGTLESTGVVGLVFESPELRFAEGLSLDTWGRLKLRETPSDTKSWASVSLLIEDPRSEWETSCPGSIPCLAMVSAKSSAARCLHSLFATIQPTT